MGGTWSPDARARVSALRQQRAAARKRPRWAWLRAQMPADLHPILDALLTERAARGSLNESDAGALTAPTLRCVDSPREGPNPAPHDLPATGDA